jgi:anti-sigma factor RsiW
VTATCTDLEAALRGDDPELAAAFARHAEGCPACGEELALWNEISAAAPSLRKEWPSPGLEARIRERLALERRARPRIAPAAWLSLAAAACLLVALLARPFLHPPSTPSGAAAIPTPAIDETAERLLTERALAEVEKAEGAYVQSIDALAKVAEKHLEEARSPILVNYREKLLVLDSAIDDCRVQIERNRFNAHLRLELLSIYREKQRTLQALLKEDPDAL